MKNRKIAASVSSLSQKKIGRIIVFTGARQTGKTTLARKLFSDYRYLSIEDPVTRQDYKKLTAAQWHLLFPKAVLDEVQKESVLVESIKSAYDQFPDVRYILLGSGQLLLLEKVKKSLADRRRRKNGQPESQVF
jgi:predicted AAA+ superfamily ATPase